MMSPGAADDGGDARLAKHAGLGRVGNGEGPVRAGESHHQRLDGRVVLRNQRRDPRQRGGLDRRLVVDPAQAGQDVGLRVLGEAVDDLVSVGVGEGPVFHVKLQCRGMMLRAVPPERSALR